ncbi:c-type cytochrome [Azospirillum halopraeferens]|uniref:c-type cytochrome n=1 Tax=Azospirillum halopraeferens TaxID=34010 RepID=UPI0003FF227A|nr:cytochrome c [Azospirillum halopraeferens]
MRTLTILAAAAAVCIAHAGSMAPALAADPLAQVKERETLMKKLGGGMKAVGGFVKNEGPTAADVQAAAAAITEVSTVDPRTVFPEGTAIGVGDSEAKPELWQNWTTAEGYWNDLKPAAEQLTAAAGSGDRAQVARAMQAVGKVCQTCHEDFRLKK